MTKNLKYILIPALAGMMFAACNNTPQGPSQAELDAQVETKVKAATDKMHADCDAQIMQAAQMKKDSILIKMGKMKAPVANAGTKPATSKTTTTTTTTVKTEPVKTEPVKTNPKADRFNNNGGKTVNEADTKSKTDRMESGGKKEVTPEDTKKKADRFRK